MELKGHTTALKKVPESAECFEILGSQHLEQNIKSPALGEGMRLKDNFINMFFDFMGFICEAGDLVTTE